jgi:glycosyltransferase involved in cell wall biosynthesis
MSQTQSLADPSSDRSEPLSHDRGENILITVLMPCLNESRTLAACIEQSHAGCRAALAMRSTTAVVEEQGSEPNLGYEIVIADNGSSDGSPGIALAHGARVVPVEQRGYGAALLGGIAAARGKYIVMGDSDCSYDFGEVPRFIAKLEEGFDLVVGNRFAGGIMPGAMPWHHRYIGNPVLSGIGQLLYRTPCRDWHCGLRVFKRNSINRLHLRCSGMEFASEMVLRASQERLTTAEITAVLYSDGRDSRSHLRSLRDGWRHVLLMLRSFKKRNTK